MRILINKVGGSGYWYRPYIGEKLDVEYTSFDATSCKPVDTLHNKKVFGSRRRSFLEHGILMMDDVSIVDMDNEEGFENLPALEEIIKCPL